jgi:hypothetical protein
MDILGLIGQQYMFLLLVVLFIGFGLGTWAIIKSLFSNEGNKGQVKTSVNSNSNKANNIAMDSKITKIIGGINMNNGWLKLGIFSLVGLVISFGILGFISSNNSYNMNMSNGMSINGTMNTQGTMTMPTSSNSMNMNSANTMNMSGQTMNSSNNVNMQNQLYQMQNQLNQMQMQLQNMMNSSNSQMQMPANNSNSNSNSNMNNNSNSNSNSSGSMSSMPMM